MRDASKCSVEAEANGILVGNNPVNYTDPHGLVSWKGVASVALLALGAKTLNPYIVGAGLALGAWEIYDNLELGEKIIEWWDEHVVDPLDKETKKDPLEKDPPKEKGCPP